MSREGASQLRAGMACGGPANATLLDQLWRQESQRRYRAWVLWGVLATVIALSATYADLLAWRRYQDALSTVLTLLDDATPPDLPEQQTLQLTEPKPEATTPWRSLRVDPLPQPEQRLDEARWVVAGGRPLGKRILPLLQPLADALGAGLGATRGAVDAGMAPARCQIGQTGAHIAPELYLAVGISGAPQHLAGITQSRCIVAINKDANAPLVQQADYLLQADMFEVLPSLLAALAREPVTGDSSRVQ